MAAAPRSPPSAASGGALSAARRVATIAEVVPEDAWIALEMTALAMTEWELSCVNGCVFCVCGHLIRSPPPPSAKHSAWTRPAAGRQLLA
jgi:hypothetical protein